MRNIYRSLLLLIVGATQKELARHVRYLKVENQILRSKLPARLSVTAQERNRLVRFGARLGTALNELVTIVHPSTLRRWVRESRGKRKPPARKVGRPRTAAQIERLIVKLAKETGWGYKRILGELKKLRITCVSRSTVKRILERNGLDHGPKRGLGTWDEFVKLHAATLWQCDFLTKKVLTPKGFREMFLLVFLHVGTRRVFAAPATFHPNETWVKEQAAAFVRHVAETGLGADIVLHDRDAKFTASFDDVLKANKLRIQRTPYRSPNTVAFVERFIQTLKQECLNYFVVVGERHMNYLVREFLAHYHGERPHQGMENEVLVKPPPKKRKTKPPADVELLPSIRCQTRLGGLLKHYSRAA